MSTDVHIEVVGDMGMAKEELRKIFEKEIDDFSTWMHNNPDWKQQGPLTRPERVIMLTYLMNKYAGHIDAKTYGQEKK